MKIATMNRRRYAARWLIGFALLGIGLLNLPLPEWVAATVCISASLAGVIILPTESHRAYRERVLGTTKSPERCQ